jgi:hypothetical protein
MGFVAGAMISCWGTQTQLTCRLACLARLGLPTIVLTKSLGPVEIEWVFDGVTAWIVQISVQKRPPQDVTFDKDIEWVDFLHTKGRIEDFRHRVIALQESNKHQGSKKGIRVLGNVSPLTHWGEIA